MASPFEQRCGRMSSSSRSVPDEATYLKLREEIISGTLMPNQHLVEIDLCERLHASRSSVRLLLLRLEHEGLVVREPNRGAHVRFIEEKEALEITEARAVLEAFAAGRAAELATDDDIASIIEIHREMTLHLENGDLLAYSDTNRRLHNRIIEASRHATVQKMLQELKAQLVRFQYRTVLVPGRAQLSIAEHSALVEAVCAHDAEGAAEAMTHHLRGVISALKQAAAGESGYPISETTSH